MQDCPYCLTPVSADDNRTVCERCGTAHHSECWEENAGCAVRDCGAAPARIEIDIPNARREKVVLTKEAVERARSRRNMKVRNPCMGCGREIPQGQLYCVECTPARPEDQDAKNLLPVMVIVAILAVLVGWMIVANGCEDTSETDQWQPHGAASRTLQVKP